MINDWEMRKMGINKKFISISLIMSIVLSIFAVPAVSYATYNDISEDAIYKEAVERLSSLEIINGDAYGLFNPSNYLSRAEFAKIAVSAAGLKEQALSESGVSFYSDVPYGHWASGYINVSARQGFLTGFGDGNFRPDENITYSQVITAILKILGYTDSDLGGIWPYNYIEKAKALKITDGIQFRHDEPVSRGIAALFIDRALLTEVKKQSANETSVTLIEKSGLASIKECVITATYGTDSSVSQGKVKTDTGEYTTVIGNMDEYIGQKVKLIINEDNEVIDVIVKKQSIQKAMVKSVTGNDVSVFQNIQDGQASSSYIITIPSSIPMYYHGEKGTYSSYKENISMGSVIILSGAFQGSYDHAVLLDPDLEGPVTVMNDVKNEDEYIGNLDIRDKANIQVIRNGENASLTDIKAYDVVYMLKDSPDNIKRLFVYDEKITGVYEEALPSKAFVKKIVVSGTEVEVDTQKAVSMLDESPGAYKINDRITVLTGLNGKAVDVVDLNAADVSNFAVVINTRQSISEEEENKGEREYHATLFKIDGSTQEYKTDKDYAKYKGDLVTFDFKDGYVVLKSVSYTPISGIINKDDRTIGNVWMAKQPIIFDLVSNPEKGDAVVKKVNLSDLSMKTLYEKDVIHAERRNEFGDIQLLFLNNVTYSGYQYGIVTDVEGSSRDTSISYSYKIDIKGEEKEFNRLNVKYSVSKNEPVAIEMQGNSINRMVALQKVASGKVQACDDERIKVDGKIYRLGEEVQAYKRSNMKLVPASMSELMADGGKKVNMYSERMIENGGKIRIIVIQ